MRSLWSTATLVAVSMSLACSGDADDTGAIVETLTVESEVCKVSYELHGSVDDGFVAEARVTSKLDDLASWELSWDVPGVARLAIPVDARLQPGITAAVSRPIGASETATPQEFFLNGKSCGAVTQRAAAAACTATNWQAGSWYVTGSVVKYSNGQYYIAEHDNPGYDPLISTWFWEPTTCTGGGTGGGGGGSTCTASNWQAGTWYTTGTKVKYSNGQYYIAEHDNPGYDPLISTWFWDPTTCSGGGTNPPPPPPPPPSGGFGSLLPESTFNAMFPNRNGFYRYSDLVAAVASYPAFAGTGDTATRKREIAAFLANTAHETGNFVYIEEINKAPYCSPSASCPCNGGWYYGRGPIQLSWNYNYCAAGNALGLPLNAQPQLVSTNAKIAWQTGLWFWMTSTGAGWTTAHNAMANGNGFGETIRTINGSLECGGGNPSTVQIRVSNYLKFCQMLGVDPGPNLYC